MRDPTCSWSFGILVYKVCSLGRHTAEVGHGLSQWDQTAQVRLCPSYTQGPPLFLASVLVTSTVRSVQGGDPARKAAAAVTCMSLSLHVLCGCSFGVCMEGVSSLGCLQNFSPTTLLAALTH